MQHIIYFLIAILSTGIGAITGLGGGIIIKPVMDIMGDYPVATIGVISSITVFAMSCVSLGRNLHDKRKNKDEDNISVDMKIALPLGAGSALGGILGDFLFGFVSGAIGSDSLVKAIQNTILIVLIVLILIYMQLKDKLPTLHQKSILAACATGLVLGVVSSFLGIGGGPVNIALILFVFSYNMKQAVFCSILSIFFAQIAKLGAIALAGGFAKYDFTVLPVMLVGAVMGGFIGAGLGKKFSQKTIELLFNALQVVIIIICAINVVRNI